MQSLQCLLHFEPTNICNLRCPFCTTGARQNPLPKGRLAEAHFKEVIDELADTLVLVRLDGNGEPFLNSDTFAMIDYATRKRVASAISSNLTTFKPETIHKLIDAGLDYLIISLDGATRETYESKRVGASFDQVLANIRELVRLKQARRSRLPFIETQFILFDDNADQVPQITALSRELGVDRLLIKEGRDEKLHLTREKEPRPASGNACYWLWYVLNVTWDGNLKDCCTSGLSNPFSFGNIIHKPVLEEWNNERMRGIRRLFIEKNTDTIRDLDGCKCLSCHMIPWV